MLLRVRATQIAHETDDKVTVSLGSVANSSRSLVHTSLVVSGGLFDSPGAVCLPRFAGVRVRVWWRVTGAGVQRMALASTRASSRPLTMPASSTTAALWLMEHSVRGTLRARQRAA